MTTGDVEAARIGELIHGGSYGFHVTLLSIPPKEEVYRRAREGYVIPRNLETSIGEFQVQGAVDMIRPEDEGYTIRELKTTSKRSVPMYLLSPAEFQVQIYGWILSRYLPVKKLELIFMNQKTKETLRSY